jgi:hypothetical protein
LRRHAVAHRGQASACSCGGIETGLPLIGNLKVKELQNYNCAVSGAVSSYVSPGIGG